jgi:hypothetical protein
MEPIAVAQRRHHDTTPRWNRSGPPPFRAGQPHPAEGAMTTPSEVGEPSRLGQRARAELRAECPRRTPEGANRPFEEPRTRDQVVAHAGDGLRAPVAPRGSEG